jgi:hypothetical protein
MAFYIRKAFKTGPVRLNLSKGGLGLSAGVTGARVGINRRGTYVHGGRHGLYYRKYQNGNRKGEGSRPVRQRDKGSPRGGGTIDLFRDTGVTWQGGNSFKNHKSVTPKLPSLDILTTGMKAASAVIAGIFLVSVLTGVQWLIAVSGLSVLILAARLMGERHRKHKAVSFLNDITQVTESEGKLPGSFTSRLEGISPAWKERISRHLHAVIGEMAMRNEKIATLMTLRRLDRECPVDNKWVTRLRVAILGSVLDEMLEDHILSEEEEESILELVHQMNIDKNHLKSELERIRHFSAVRGAIELPLKSLDAGVPLVRGETAYEKFDGARLLNERVLNRFQRSNEQYREIGYEIDMEGDLILTDRRMMLISRGTREYRLNRVVNVTADPEAGIVEISLSNRKNPVLITVKQPLILAARLELIISEKIS